MLIEYREEALAMRWLQQVRHFVDDDVFEEVLGLLLQLSVEADLAGVVVAAAPLGFHALQEVALNLKP